MPTLEEISAKVDELQTALDAEQQQVADLLASKEATITGLNDTIASLQVLVADGGTPEARQAVLDKLSALKSDLEGTVVP
jgi:uncharacterized coiled-coil protein SlyX